MSSLLKAAKARWRLCAAVGVVLWCGWRLLVIAQPWLPGGWQTAALPEWREEVANPASSLTVDYNWTKDGVLCIAAENKSTAFATYVVQGQRLVRQPSTVYVCGHRTGGKSEMLWPLPDGAAVCWPSADWHRDGPLVCRGARPATAADCSHLGNVYVSPWRWDASAARYYGMTLHPDGLFTCVQYEARNHSIRLFGAHWRRHMAGYAHGLVWTYNDDTSPTPCTTAVAENGYIQMAGTDHTPSYDWSPPGNPLVFEAVLSPSGDEVAMLTLSRPESADAAMMRMRRLLHVQDTSLEMMWVCHLNGTGWRPVMRLSDAQAGSSRYAHTVRWTPDGKRLGFCLKSTIYSVPVPQ